MFEIYFLQGTIHASIRKSLARKSRPLFIEGCIYSIKDFIVEENKSQYRPVYHKLKIIFMSTTSVSKVEEINHSIPQYGFEFTDYDTIISRCNDKTYLTSILKRCKSVSCICRCAWQIGMGWIYSRGEGKRSLNKNTHNPAFYWKSKKVFEFQV